MSSNKTLVMAFAGAALGVLGISIYLLVALTDLVADGHLVYPPFFVWWGAFIALGGFRLALVAALKSLD